MLMESIRFNHRKEALYALSTHAYHGYGTLVHSTHTLSLDCIDRNLFSCEMELNEVSELIGMSERKKTHFHQQMCPKCAAHFSVCNFRNCLLCNKTYWILNNSRSISGIFYGIPFIFYLQSFPLTQYKFDFHANFPFPSAIHRNDMIEYSISSIAVNCTKKRMRCNSPENYVFTCFKPLLLSRTLQMKCLYYFDLFLKKSDLGGEHRHRCDYMPTVSLEVINIEH